MNEETAYVGMNLKSSAARCDVDPIPSDAKLSLPGLALA